MRYGPNVALDAVKRSAKHLIIEIAASQPDDSLKVETDRVTLTIQSKSGNQLSFGRN